MSVFDGWARSSRQAVSPRPNSKPPATRPAAHPTVPTSLPPLQAPSAPTRSLDPGHGNTVAVQTHFLPSPPPPASAQTAPLIIPADNYAQIGPSKVETCLIVKPSGPKDPYAVMLAGIPDLVASGQVQDMNPDHNDAHRMMGAPELAPMAKWHDQLKTRYNQDNRQSFTEYTARKYGYTRQG